MCQHSSSLIGKLCSTYLLFCISNPGDQRHWKVGSLSTRRIPLPHKCSTFNLSSLFWHQKLAHIIAMHPTMPCKDIHSKNEHGWHLLLHYLQWISPIKTSICKTWEFQTVAPVYTCIETMINQRLCKKGNWQCPWKRPNPAHRGKYKKYISSASSFIDTVLHSFLQSNRTFWTKVRENEKRLRVSDKVRAERKEKINSSR